MKIIYSRNSGGCNLASTVNFVKTNNLSDDGTCGSVAATGVDQTLQITADNSLTSFLQEVMQ
ncbi:MAG: hypothetical protein R3B65_02260 [Candidatus Paceibacterota bacterium]